MKYPKAVIELQRIFDSNKDKRICVVGGSCTGKTTLLRYFPNAVDMDDLLFGNTDKGLAPLLTREEIEYVCSPVWTEEVGNFMNRKAKELIRVEPGHPVFGTVVFPTDLIVEIAVPELEYRERIVTRGANPQSVFDMKAQIESEIEKSSIPKIIVQNT